MTVVCFCLCIHGDVLWLSDVDLNAQNQATLWTPLHAATFQEHGPVGI